MMPYGQAKSFDVRARPRGRGWGYQPGLPTAKRARKVRRESFGAQVTVAPKQKQAVAVLSPRAIMIRANHARRRAAWLSKHNIAAAP